MSDKKIIEDDFVKALKDMNTYMDISVDDLMTINQKANQHARFRLSQNIAVKDFMTKPVCTVFANVTIAEAAEIMLEKHVAGLPVVDAKNNLLGIFTEADLLTAVGLPIHNPPQSVWRRMEAIFSHEPSLGNFNISVSELMIKDVVTIGKDKTLGDVLEKMKNYNIKRLIVTEDRNVIGIITRSNLVRVFLEQLAQQNY